MYVSTKNGWLCKCVQQCVLPINKNIFLFLLTIYKTFFEPNLFIFFFLIVIFECQRQK